MHPASPAPSAPAEPRAPFRILIAADEEILLQACGRILIEQGYTVHTERRGGAALEHLRRHGTDFVMTDSVLPDMDGLALMREIKDVSPRTRVVFITGFASVQESVDVMRAGAWDYIPRPFTATQLRILVGRAANEAQRPAPPPLREPGPFDEVVGDSGAMRAIRDLLCREAGPTTASVFVSGEPGTGKSHIARAVHANSRRGDYPFIAVDCTLAEHLLDVELFGFEVSTFYGEKKLMGGALELATGGSVYLREVAAMSLDLQQKLLRAMREGRATRVGWDVEFAVDVRWIAGTVADPEQAVRDGRLRPELLSRLNELAVHLPPLRQRREDVRPLAYHFLHRHAIGGREGVRLGEEVLRWMEGYDWPENVRELRDVVEQMVLAAGPGAEITAEALPPRLRDAPREPGG